MSRNKPIALAIGSLLCWGGERCALMIDHQ
jgi:hypothetical protein